MTNHTAINNATAAARTAIADGTYTVEAWMTQRVAVECAAIEWLWENCEEDVAAVAELAFCD
jgi:hypothetical protein